MPSLEQARKAVVGVLAVVLAYGATAADVLGHSDLSTKDGIISAVFALLTGLGVYHVPNESSSDAE